MTGHIYVYGYIGRDRGQISFENIDLQLGQNKAAEDLILHVISPGGDVFEGEAIYNALKNSRKQITTHIEGTCASIATLIAAAGSTMVMNRTARFMIHNPKIPGLNGMADSRDLRHVADQLDQIKTLLIDVYDRKTTLGKEKLWELYDNETWLTAQEAQTMGFVDDVQDALKAVASIDLNKFKMKEKSGLMVQFQNFLRWFKNMMSETLADGRVIMIESEDDQWQGKRVALEDGSALPAGEYPTTSGKVITVDDQGMITAVKQAEPAQQNTEMEDKIKQLEQQLSEAKAAKDAADLATKAAADSAADLLSKANTAEARALKFENKITGMEKDFIALKELMMKTVGDPSEPPKGPVLKVSNNGKEYDPMAEDLGNAWITSRPNSNFKSK